MLLIYFEQSPEKHIHFAFADCSSLWSGPVLAGNSCDTIWDIGHIPPRINPCLSDKLRKAQLNYQPLQFKRGCG